MIFANIMQDKEGLANFWKKLLHKYRFVIMTDDSFEEKLSFKLNRLNVFVFIGLCVFSCSFATILLISYSPLKGYVPGKSTDEVQKELIGLALKSDSLEKILKTRGLYLQNINNLINGNELITPNDIDNVGVVDFEVSFKKSKEDSLLRSSVETADKGTIIIGDGFASDFLMFFPPINGIITDIFNRRNKHFGIDVVAKEKTRVSSVLDGTVVISNWTSETGYVIGVQHKNGYFSLYKHNSVLLKSVGDFVSAGDHIAIIGNSGELSSGPHLHFELWHKGSPVDPENYISF